jgi:hypothetical protein
MVAIPVTIVVNRRRNVHSRRTNDDSRRKSINAYAGRRNGTSGGKYNYPATNQQCNSAQIYQDTHDRSSKVELQIEFLTMKRHMAMNGGHEKTTSQKNLYENVTKLKCKK